MAIDFEKLKKQAKALDNKSKKEIEKSISKTEVNSAKSQAKELTSKEKSDLTSAGLKALNNVKALGSNFGQEKQILTANEKQAVAQNTLNNLAKSSAYRFETGFADGLIPIAHTTPTTDTEKAIDTLTKKTTSGKAGHLAGVTSQYLIPYGATEKAAATLATKGLAKYAPKLATSKMANALASNALQDATVGLALNTADVVGKQGLTGKDAVKNLAIQEALDFGLGGALTLASGKIIRKASDIDTLTKDEIKEVEEIAKKNTELKNSFTKDNLKQLRNSEAETPSVTPIKEELPTKAEATVEPTKAETLKSTDNTIDVKKTISDDVASDKYIAVVKPKKTSLKTKAKDFYNGAYARLVDSADPIVRLGKKAGNDISGDIQALRTSKGTQEYIFHNGIVDANGKLINEKSYKDLIGSIDNLDDFNVYALHLHNLDRAKQGTDIWKENGKAVFTPEQSQQIVNEMLAKHPNFAEKSKELNDWWQDFLQTWYVDRGLWSKEDLDYFNAKYPNYVPTTRAEKGGIGAGLGTSHISTGNGVKKAKGGESAVNRIEDSFLMKIDESVKRVRRNELYADIIKSLQENPEEMKGFGIVLDNEGDLVRQGIDTEVADGMLEQALKENKDGSYTLTAYIDGKPISANISSEVKQALELIENSTGGGASETISKYGKLLTNPIKAGITGLNPVFAVANVMRDFPTYLIQSEHSLGDNFKGLWKAFEGMANPNSNYRQLFEQYKAMGGKNSGYYAQGKGFENQLKTEKRNLWDNTKEILSFLGESGETLPRFAEFINTLEKTGDAKKALSDSADVTVNFSRSGNVTKTLDAWVLYLNAAVQGLDKFARQVKAHPVKTAVKGGSIITVPFVASYMACKDNPYYHELTDRVKQNNYVLPNMMGEKDENGVPKTFIKIPLNREYGVVLASSLNALFETMNGDVDALNNFKTTVKDNFAPPNPLTDNVLSPIMINLPQNKDFADRKIVPTAYEKKRATEQYDYSTSGIAKGISNVADKLHLGDTLSSPMKVDYLIDSYGGFIGSELKSATGGGNTSERLTNSTSEPFKKKFTADPRYSSGVLSEFYDTKDELEKGKNDSEKASAEYKSYNKISNKISDNIKAEKELLASGRDKKEIKNEVNKLREERNALAKSAKEMQSEVDDAPLFYNLNTNIQSKYDESLGMNKNDFAKAYNIQSKQGSSVAKALALIENGNTESQIREIASVSDSEYDRALKMYQNGITPNEIQELYDGVKEKYGKTAKGLLAIEW